mgnify:CR=1 FL=1
MEAVFTLLVTIGVMLVGVDFLAKSMGPRAHRAYRQILKGVMVRFRNFVKKKFQTNRKFFVGVLAGVLLALYFLNQLP